MDILTDHVLMVNKPTTTSKSLTKHLSIKKLLMEEFFINATVEYIYFSHHNAARILIKKNAADFHTIP